MGKTSDLKKINDIKGTCHAKIGSIKDRNDMDLTEAKDIKVARIHRKTVQKRSSAQNSHMIQQSHFWVYIQKN